MSKTINKAIILGHLTKDPEVKVTSAGKAVVNIDIATNERFKKDGEWTDRPEYHRVVLWERLAEIAGEYLKKGSKVYLEGYIQTRSWEKDGQKKYSTEIVGRDLIMLDNRPDAAPAPQPAMAGEVESDIPF